jgi:hypothetical protein
MTEQEYRDAVYDEAKETKTPEALTEFIAKRYAETLDYGTIVYACSATMQAAFNVMNAHPQFGGITGFQAGCLMWEMVHKFGMFEKDAPLRIQDFNNLLYPQYDEKFATTISPETAAHLKEKAKVLAGKNGEFAHSEVMARWKKMADGWLPEFVAVESGR